jgi:serine/threonine protein kinase/tetratricopeptide (TPR) repeat protein
MPDEPRPAVADPVEQLLDEVVTLPDAEQAPAVERICRDNPDLAQALRSRFALFRRFAGPALADDGPTDAPRHFGEYTLVRELGRGGMGVVHLARQQRGDQERLVALKLVRDRLLFSPQARERLRREGAAAFRLDHPGICQAYDTGEIDGTPFVSMRYVPGRTLAAIVADAHDAGRLPELPHEPDDGKSSTTTASNGRVQGLLLLAEQVARALHAAHEAGFVHRDVKPGNIMVGNDGNPVLLDFGLVHDEHSTHGLTLGDQPIGTPSYMSPEQIEPKGRRIDRTTDVYSLGATLFEALTGEPPFTGTNREELFRRILGEEPPRLRGAGVSRDVEVVVRTALDKDPDRRYRTALAFAEDLRRARLAEPIVAAPPSLGRRLVLWSRRNPLAAAMLTLLVAAQGVIVVLAVRAEQRAEEARAALAQAETDFGEASVAMDALTRVAQRHLSDVPWMESTRRALFERVLAFHERTALRRSADGKHDQQEARARLHAAQLQEDLGRNEEAQQLAEEAVRTFAIAEPTAETKRWLAHGHHLLAVLAQKRGDLDAAEESFRFASAALREIEALGASLAEDRLHAVQALLATAQVLESRAGRLEEAKRALDEALAITTGVTQNDFRLEHAAGLRLRAKLARLEGRDSSAVADMQQACEVLRSIVAALPHDRDAKGQLGTSLIALGLAQRQAKDLHGALASYEEARKVHEELVASFPFLVVHRSNLAHVHNNLSVLLRSTGAQEKAREQLTKAIEIAGDVVRVEPDHLDARHLLAACAYNLANQLVDLDAARAVALYRDSLAQAEALLAAMPDDRRALDLAGRVATSLGAMLARQKQYADAMAVFTSARRTAQRLLDGHGYTRQAGRNAAILHNNAGSLACEMGDLPDAIDFLQRAVKFDEAQVAESAEDSQAHALLLNHRVRLATIVEMHDPAAAGGAWDAALQAAAERPAAVETQLRQARPACFDLACALRGRAASHLRSGDPEAAAPLLQRSAATIERDDGLPCQVELLLLARDHAVLASLRNDTAMKERALAKLATAASAVAPRLAGSAFQGRRVKGIGGFIDAALPEHARAPIFQALSPLGDAIR